MGGVATWAGDGTTGFPNPIHFPWLLLTPPRIFIVNGAMTMFLAILGRILIVDFPDKVSRSRFPFLKPSEVRAIQNKLERDRQDAEFDKLTLKKFFEACLRWDLWALYVSPDYPT